MIEEILKKLKKYNIKDYEIFNSTNSITSIDTDKTNFDKKEFEYDEGYGLRILKNNKITFTYFSDKNHIESSIQNALKIIKIKPKLHNFTFNNKNPKIKVKTYDKKIIDLDEKDIKELIKDMIQNIKYTPISCSVIKNISEVRIINSEGLDCSQKETSLLAFAYCSKEGQTGSEFYESYKYDRNTILNLSKIASKKANQKTKQISSVKLPVILEDDALINIIDNLFLTQITGDKKHHNSSYLIGKENMNIASNNLTIYEDPFCEGHSKTNFDGEGIEDDISVLIDKGKFTGFVYDKETAALSKVDKKGFCSRSNYTQYPTIGYSNILIKPGKTKNLEEIHREYVVINNLFGFHTVNTTTGDFSLIIGNGYLVKNNKKQFIQGNILSGNTYALLKNIQDIEKSLKMKGSYIVPRILVKGLTIS
ncbi:TldD/PmbA family protein [Candidatus Micrarchaeota archaeon]|jgi:PmbA protein|nr:TldD/PmbA family protein [Candidatus Micrarchaeota archaeon]